MLLLAMSIFTFFTVVLETAGERSLLPTKSLSSNDFSFKFKADPPIWTVIAVSSGSYCLVLSLFFFTSIDFLQFVERKDPSTLPLLSLAVSVVPQWDDDGPLGELKPACVLSEVIQQDWHATPESVYLYPRIDGVVFTCPGRYGVLDRECHHFME